jgi:DNA-binding XRE family transcriptional regulator
LQVKTESSYFRSVTSGLDQLSELVAARRGFPSPGTRRALRLGAGATLKDVALAVGVSRQCIYQWETGETTPRGANLVRYAAVLDLFRGAA